MATSELKLRAHPEQSKNTPSHLEPWPKRLARKPKVKTWVYLRPGLLRTCVDLRSPCSRSNLHVSRRKFTIFWTPNPIQRNSSSYSNLLAHETRDIC